MIKGKTSGLNIFLYWQSFKKNHRNINLQHLHTDQNDTAMFKTLINVLSCIISQIAGQKQNPSFVL